MKYEPSLSFAKSLDRKDPLKSFRSQFHIPKENGKPVIYFTGNSLGLQPKNTNKFINEELEDWSKLGVEGHFHARRPWLYYHKFARKTLAKIVGAKPGEVLAMNQLTVNLHLLLISFYQPNTRRFKIICEAGAFSSDQYALESQVKFHKLDPEKAIIELKPRVGEFILRIEDIVSTIKEHRDELSLVMLGGVQYYTGQFFDIQKITEAAHDAGAYAGFDLAHAVGNVPLALHKHNVDFAAWCSYKYLNSGPGGVAGAFIHERHSRSFELPRFAGWWGHNEKERFQMKKGFKPMPGVDGWQLSNFPIISGAAHLASLEIFEKAGIKNLRKKSELLTGYLEFLLNQIDLKEKKFKILTPSKPGERGCQLSIFIKRNGKKVFGEITRAGICADWRESNLPWRQAGFPARTEGVIRVAPVPLYNTFEEVYRFAEVFSELLKN